MKQLTAIDLFSGAGGLSLGVKRGGFKICAAVEIDPIAAQTYRRNHPGVPILQRDISELSSEEILRQANVKNVSLVMGCAPCQGFCSLTSKLKRDDPRNGLVLEMARLIEEIRPDAVLMENVPGLLTRGRKEFDAFLGRLECIGYRCTYRVVQMADYGVPQNRRRLVLLAGKGFEIAVPKPTHASSPKLGSGLLPWVSLRESIYRMPAPVTLREALVKGGPAKHNWHVVRDLQAHTKTRVRAAIPGKTWLRLPEWLRPKCHRQGYVGFMNTYGRMRWDQISVTITAGCTTPAKGRFGHPDRRRYTISVREAALLQTFPERYHFTTDQMDAVCGLIGNAVPPAFAQIVGRRLRNALEKHYGRLANAGQS